MHDWGAVGLAFAQRHPERVERLVMINAVPLLPGYRWHRIARVWRTPVLGELVMGSMTRPLLRFTSRRPTSRPAAARRVAATACSTTSTRAPSGRSCGCTAARPATCSPPPAPDSTSLRMPALVVWGAHDPYIPARFGRDYAAALGSAALGDVELLELADAGHWPWLDRPDVIDRVVDFLRGLSAAGRAHARLR